MTIIRGVNYAGFALEVTCYSSKFHHVSESHSVIMTPMIHMLCEQASTNRPSGHIKVDRIFLLFDYKLIIAICIHRYLFFTVLCMQLLHSHTRTRTHICMLQYYVDQQLNYSVDIYFQLAIALNKFSQPNVSFNYPFEHDQPPLQLLWMTSKSRISLKSVRTSWLAGLSLCTSIILKNKQATNLLRIMIGCLQA